MAVPSPDNTLRRLARSAVFFALAGLAFLPGLALLSHAAWVALSAAQGPAVASLAIGIAWCGLGGAFALIARRPPRPGQDAGRLPASAFAEAFLTGLDLGRAAAGGPRRAR